MIKLSIAIADTSALPSAFVVFRGFKTYIPIAASMGYQGVELALKNASEISPGILDRCLKDSGISVSCISTGQVYADTGFMFTDQDPIRRLKLKGIFKEFIDLAADYSQLVNIGRVRGMLDKDSPDNSRERFIEMVTELCEYASSKEVKLILEPVNRYELNFINNVEQGAALVEEVNQSNFKLMPDLFHMNIEDADMGQALIKHKDIIEYIHLADSNRLAPGQGHTDFEGIFSALRTMGFSGWCSVEILPKPEPVTAARQAARYLLPLIEKYV